MTGRPRRRRWSRCSTEAKNASASAWRIVALDTNTCLHLAWQSVAVATMADLDELAMAMPQTTKEMSDDGRPSYHVHGKLYCFHRGQRPDAVDAVTGERMIDVLMFRVPDLDVKELL